MSWQAAQDPQRCLVQGRSIFSNALFATISHSSKTSGARIATTAFPIMCGWEKSPRKAWQRWQRGRTKERLLLGTEGQKPPTRSCSEHFTPTTKSAPHCNASSKKPGRSKRSEGQAQCPIKGGPREAKDPEDAEANRQEQIAQLRSCFKQAENMADVDAIRETRTALLDSLLQREHVQRQ